MNEGNTICRALLFFWHLWTLEWMQDGAWIHSSFLLCDCRNSLKVIYGCVFLCGEFFADWDCCWWCRCKCCFFPENTWMWCVSHGCIMTSPSSVAHTADYTCALEFCGLFFCCLALLRVPPSISSDSLGRCRSYHHRDTLQGHRQGSRSAKHFHMQPL